MKFFTNSHTRVMAIAFVMSFAACTKDKEPNDQIFDIRGNATSVSMQNNDAAYGNITGGYSATYKKIAFNINWYNLSDKATGSSLGIYDGRTVEVIKTFPVTEGTTTGLTAADMQLSDEQATKLSNGEWVFMVNTVDHPEGELQGKMLLIRTQ